MPALLAMLDYEDVRALDEEQPEPPPLRPEVLGAFWTRFGGADAVRDC